MRITITCDLPDDLCEPDHDTGLTEDGYCQLHEALMQIGAENIETRA